MIMPWQKGVVISDIPNYIDTDKVTTENAKYIKQTNKRFFHKSRKCDPLFDIVTDPTKKYKRVKYNEDDELR